MNVLSRRACLAFAAWMAFLPLVAADLPETITPPPSPVPQIHSAKIFGVRPGAPFLFAIAATGTRPVTFDADGLPEGLKLDRDSGQITGTVAKAGDYPVILFAKNSLGACRSELIIEVGNTIALTPPMGWNSWYCFGSAVSDEKIRAAADAMVSSGLVNHGWSYINIDDYWQVNPKSEDKSLQGAERDDKGNILPNSRFPDMKALVDYIHSKGLKAGIYSSPGPTTCGGGAGSLDHVDQDAKQFAAWGFDYLKYDWCTYGKIRDEIDPKKTTEGLKKPYRDMSQHLNATGRDLVFSLCQYGVGDVWKWGASVGGNSWRTTNDIADDWKSVFANAQKQVGLETFAGPGHWNDPDMLMVGKLGGSLGPQDTKLTPEEQYTHVSLWCLQAAPLLLSCDLTQLDPFTLGLLSNDDVIAIDQDSAGQAAHLVGANDREPNPVQMWVKPLRRGTAVGLVNTSDQPAQRTITYADLGTGYYAPIYDVWSHKKLGVFLREFASPPIPPHGVLLLRFDNPPD